MKDAKTPAMAGATSSPGEPPAQPEKAVTSSYSWVRVAVALVLGFCFGRVYTQCLDVFILAEQNLLSYAVPDMSTSDAPVASCDASGLPPIPALLDERSWIYDELSPVETRTVAEYAMRELDIKSSMAGQASTGNTLSGTESVVLIPPNKAAAQAYVLGETDVAPPRYAKVAVVRGLVVPPDVMLYRIGPLAGTPTDPYIVKDSKDPSIVPLTKPGEIPYAKRPYDVNDDTSIKLSIPELTKLKPFLVEFLGPIWDWLPGCSTGSDCWDPEAGRSIMSLQRHRVLIHLAYRAGV